MTFSAKIDIKNDMNRLFSYILLVLMLISVNLADVMPARAEQTPLVEGKALRYDVFLGTMRVGVIKVTLKNSTSGYDYTADLDSLNLARYIMKYDSINRVVGKISNNKHIPLSYRSKWRQKKYDQDLLVRYSPEGDVLEETITGSWWKDNPEVEAAQKKNIPDPITAAVVSMQKIKQLMQDKTPLPHNFDFPVYDAKRLLNLKYTIHGYKEKKVAGERKQLLHVSFKQEALAGWRESELKRLHERDAVINLYLDENYIPVLGFGQSQIGDLEIKLAKECSNLTSCNI
ncbi:MAG: hypothetical protein COV36_04670 [Alphaproteobacteria bacterium CG11_big_fil_rev_8_21_14_0_20_44_7]|nr:MAG: hypothetical protein COV36_04670 [Alphaproteobacteria bacterium CG11_big_fil_rev_8_21_14_0_20_44_7]